MNARHTPRLLRRVALVICVPLVGQIPADLSGQVNQWVVLTAAHSGLCLDVAQGNFRNGTAIQQSDCGGSLRLRESQIWNLAGDGPWYQAVVQHIGKCMDVLEGRPDPGTVVMIWDCWGGPMQLWRAEPVPATAVERVPVASEMHPRGSQLYRIVVSHSRQCLTVAVAGQEPGVPLVQEPCTDALNQHFYIITAERFEARRQAQQLLEQERREAVQRQEEARRQAEEARRQAEARRQEEERQRAYAWDVRLSNQGCWLTHDGERPRWIFLEAAEEWYEVYEIWHVPDPGSAGARDFVVGVDDQPSEEWWVENAGRHSDDLFTFPHTWHTTRGDRWMDFSPSVRERTYTVWVDEGAGVKRPETITLPPKSECEAAADRLILSRR